MYRIFTLILFASVLSLPSLEFQTSRSSRSKRNRPPIIKSFDSSSWVVAICPFMPGGACAATGTRITLEVDASDPEDDQLTYQYTGKQRCNRGKWVNSKLGSQRGIRPTDSHSRSNGSPRGKVV